MADADEETCCGSTVDAPTAPTDNNEESNAQQGDGATPLFTLQEHSNANLLKINTHDKYSTVGAIKKYIAKQLAGNAVLQTPPLPLLRGMQRIGKNPKNPHIFLAFATAEDRDAAQAALTTLTYRSKVWAVEEVTEKDLSLTHKGQQRAEETERKRPRPADNVTPEGGVRTEVLGVNLWATVPLAEQLERKEKHCLKVMRAILPPNSQNGFVSYKLRFKNVFSCEKTEGYRNHVNFSWGFDRDGKPILGFNEGAIVDGKVFVQKATIESAVTTHPLAIVVADALQELHDVSFAASNGAITVTTRNTGHGFWRRAQVRHNIRGEIMICLELDKDNGVKEGCGLTFQDMLDRIVAALTNEALREKLRSSSGLAEAQVVSIQYFTHSGTTSCPMEVTRTTIFGSSVLTETLCGLSFDLSPSAFFQVNTAGMELMMERVRESAALSPTTTLLDLCCGTGTIGLCLARYVKKVIGIEIIDAAVANARENAKRNGISNATFVAGRLEHFLPDVINSLSTEDRQDVVAILDPPRAGVNTTVLKWIRCTEAIRRVVYISCEQKALENDCPGLTKPPTNSYRGTPFEVESGFGVDLFPHTPHVEMVAVLARKNTQEVAPAVEATSAKLEVDDVAPPGNSGDQDV